MSPDGVVYDIYGNEIGLIEIKCPQKFYKPLKEYLADEKPYTENYDHIWRTHYAQMQMGMAIFNKEWCDYIVYCLPENYVFLERVPRNRKYWESLYSEVKIFITEILDPVLKSQGSKYPLLPR